MALWVSDILPEIQKELDDASFEAGGSNASYLLKWANRVVRDICMRLSITAHLTESTLAAFTTSTYYQPLPANFLKISRRQTKAYVGNTQIPLLTDLATLFALDPDHNDISTSGYPSYGCITPPNFYIYPMTNCIVRLSNYYRAPVDMTNDPNSSPDIPDSYVIVDLIKNGVCVHAFHWLGEKELAATAKLKFEEYLEQYREHLYTNQFVRKVTLG